MGKPNAIGYAMHCSRSADAVIRVYDEAGNLIGTHPVPRRVEQDRKPRLGFICQVGVNV